MGFQNITYAAHTDIGRKRPCNEDAILALPEYGVFCVADGMGGTQGGAMASQAVVDALHQTLTRAKDRNAALATKRMQIKHAIENANQTIQQKATEQKLHGAGTTAVLLALDAHDPAQASAFHAGDSRLYRFRNHSLQQITKDHSFAAAIGCNDLATLPALFRNLVTRAIGLDDFMGLEETCFDIQPQDILMLCSDGLTNMLSDKRLAALLSTCTPSTLLNLPKTLVDQANAAGGLDNISVILIQTNPTNPQSKSTHHKK